MEKRFILFFIVSFAVFQLTLWYMQKDAPKPPAGQRGAVSTAASTTPTTQTPAATATPAERREPVQPGAAPTVPRSQAPKVGLTTRVYDIEFSTQGGVPIRWDIIDPRYVVPPLGQSKAEEARKKTKAREELIDPAIAASETAPRPFETVLRELNAQFYNVFNNDFYTTESVNAGGMMGTRFTSKPTPTGLRMIKTYLFKPDSFTGRFEVALVNEGQSNLTFDNEDAGLGVVMGPGLGKPANGGQGRSVIVDPVVKMGDTIAYRKPSDTAGMEVYSGRPIEWGGIQNKYFMAVLVPGNANPANPFTTARALIDRQIPELLANKKTMQYYPTLELYGKPFQIKPGERLTFSYEFFAGPKQSKVLKVADHDFNRVLFYNSWGWMRALCLGLMACLAWLHRVLGNWGAAIIMLTIIVRLVTWPLVQKGMKSQAKMVAEQARLKPLMDKINEKFKDDPQRKQQEIFKLYKEHGVNPFGMFKGCLWMLIQAPIFFALYKLLDQSIDLRGAAFLWIKDLSQPDRLLTFQTSLPIIGNEFNLLPIVMAAAQVLASRFSSQPSTDPQQQQMQRTMVYFMPIFMLFIFYGMPSGLVLYWLISTIWQVLQQLWVNKHMLKPSVAGPVVAIPVSKKA